MFDKLSYAGLTVASLYTVVAGYLVWDNYRSPGGGFINLKNVAVGLLTAPVSLPLEFLGVRQYDLYKPWVAAPYVLATAVLLYFVTALIARLFSR